MINVSYFENFTSTLVGETSLEELTDKMCNDTMLRNLTEAYRTTKEKRLKQQCPLFAVACRFQGGKARDNVVAMTGLSLVDFDHLSDLQEMKQRVCDDPHTLMCYTTVSGEGLRIIFRYELDESQTLEQQIKHYAQAFKAGNEYYERLLGAEADRKCKNVTRLSGLAHDSDIYYNPEATAFTNPERSIFRKARALVDKTEQWVEGNHHNYLMKLCFLLSDYGVAEGDAVNYLQREFAWYNGEDFPSLVASCYRTAASQFASKRNMQNVGTTKAEHVVSFLGSQQLRYDVLSRKTQIRIDEQWMELTDRRANELLYQCNRALGMNISRNTFMPMLLSSQVPEVNPLREYILALPEWDGTDYISEVAGRVKTNAEALWQQCFRKWFVAMVASWMKDEVVNHQVLVLIGPQGMFKTSWIDSLMPPVLADYRSKQSGTRFMDKDEQLRATEFGLINLDEIDRMSESELNHLKSLITATDVNVRSAYAYGKERRLRVASYAASGNKERFLTDMTGNRRWLPFRVESICSPFLHPMPYEGMYAQAWHLVQTDFNYWFDIDEIRQLTAHVEQFEVETNEAQLLPVYFEPCAAGTPGAVLLTAAEISAKLTMYGNIRRPMEIRKLGSLLKRLGYEQKRFGENGRRGYVMIELSAETINSNRRRNA